MQAQVLCLAAALAVATPALAQSGPPPPAR